MKKEKTKKQKNIYLVLFYVQICGTFPFHLENSCWISSILTGIVLYNFIESEKTESVTMEPTHSEISKRYETNRKKNSDVFRLCIACIWFNHDVNREKRRKNEIKNVIRMYIEMRIYNVSNAVESTQKQNRAFRVWFLFFQWRYDSTVYNIWMIWHAAAFSLIIWIFIGII